VADTLRDGLVGQGVRTFAVTLNESQRHWAASTVGGLVLILVMVGMLSLIFSSFLIVTIISGFLAAQRRQIGIMKIVGATRGAIIRLYLVMVIAFGLLALLISLPLSTLVADAFVTVISTTLNLNITQTGLPPSVVVLQILIASGIPMLAALIPILNATGVPPARAIRDEGVPRTGIVERALARLSVLPRPYLLALRGIFRNRGRLVLTTMTLILAGALFMSIWNIRASVPAAIASSLRMSDFDAQILFARSVSQNDVETAALETAGIEAAEGWLNTRARYILPSGQQGGEVVVNGLRHNSVFVNAQPVEGRWLQTPTPENAGDMVITGNLALAEQLSVGDTVTLLIDEQEHRFTVVGIVESLLAAAFIDYDALGDMMGLEGRATLVQVRTTDASLQGERAAADALREAFEARGWFVITARSQQDFIGGAVGGFNIVITLLLSLALMVALVGGLGLAGAISLNVLERVREIGVMRSIGAGTALLMRMFVLEGVFIGVLSAVFALIISFPFSRVFAMALGTALGQGQFSAVFSPSGVLLWLGIVVVVSAAASLLPALRGSRITIREALAYE
jgi:putative ABC transport system permease protein